MFTDSLLCSLFTAFARLLLKAGSVLAYFSSCFSSLSCSITLCIFSRTLSSPFLLHVLNSYMFLICSVFSSFEISIVVATYCLQQYHLLAYTCSWTQVNAMEFTIFAPSTDLFHLKGMDTDTAAIKIALSYFSSLEEAPVVGVCWLTAWNVDWVWVIWTVRCLPLSHTNGCWKHPRVSHTGPHILHQILFRRN